MQCMGHRVVSYANRRSCHEVWGTEHQQDKAGLAVTPSSLLSCAVSKKIQHAYLKINKLIFSGKKEFLSDRVRRHIQELIAREKRTSKSRKRKRDSSEEKEEEEKEEKGAGDAGDGHS